MTFLKNTSHPTALNKASPSPARIACLILGGGEGKRLSPLTEHCCKPAVSFGGKYRLIDVPISNALHSGCNKIFIMTQFLSLSLAQHIQKTYRTESFSSGFIELLPAEQKPSQMDWYQGTADAVRQNVNYLLDIPADYFLILSGDQLYRMNFQHLLHFAQTTDADLVISSLPVNSDLAKRMGILKVDAGLQVTSFVEKPSSEDLLESFAAPSDLFENGKKYLGSMGIYLFKRNALFHLLKQDPREDFGQHLIPTQIQNGNVFSFPHQGHWEDIGTIGSFYHANMNLTAPNPQFSCEHDTLPIYTHPSHLPGAQIFDARIKNSILCEGSFIEADEVHGSILGPRTIVGKGCVIRDSYLMGNDFYAPSVPGRLPESLKIEENCVIQRAIIDKNVFIGRNTQLINKNKLERYDGKDICIRDGIIIVSRGASLPHGFIL